MSCSPEKQGGHLAVLLRKAVRRGWSTAALLLGTLQASPSLAQAPQITIDGLPATPLIGETFCFDVNFTNGAATTGYGPYLVGSTDAGISRISIDFIDVPPRLEFIGTFDATGVLFDPISNAPISGNENGVANLARYPVGSVDQGKPPLVMEVCAVVDPGVEIGVPLDVLIYPGFEFGDSATGENGAILNPPVSSTITPQLARVNKSNSAPEGERPPGPDFVFNYRWEVDVSEGVTIDDALLRDNLPAEVQWTGGPINISAPLGAGCAVTAYPNTIPVPGGEVIVECSSVTGTAGAGDLVVTLPVYITDILDESAPDQQPIQNTVDFEYSYQGSDYNSSSNSDVLAVHAAAQKSVNGTPLPGETLTYNVTFQVTDYPGTPGSGADNFILSDILPDGMAFAGTLELIVNGATVPISPGINTDTPGTGQTTVIWDIAAALGGTLPNGSTGSLRYQATILEFYSTGIPPPPVQAADELSNSVELSYTLTQGGSGDNGSSAPVVITPNTPDKVVQSPNPLPPSLQPGQAVTFRLTLEIPAGKTSNVVFVDYLPRPVFDVADFDVNNDWTVLPPFAGLNPSVTKDAAANSVTLDFGDISSSLGATLAVDLVATITGEPFADDLYLTNLLASSYENAAGEVIQGLQAAPITVGAPDLVITKGIFSVDNPGAVITPAPPADPKDALVDGDAEGADAFDNIQYVITVENIGSQSAYTVTVQDPEPDGLSCDPITTADVEYGDGTPLPFRPPGDLFGPAGLVLTAPLEGNDDTPPGGGAPFDRDTAIITVNCSLEDTVTPGETLTNTASVRWVSTSGGNEEFPTQTDDASVTIGLPTMTKTIIASDPGYSGDIRSLHIGELLTYRLDITVPEGSSPDVKLEDIVDVGLAHVEVLDITASSIDLATSVGSFADVINNAGFLSAGSGDTAIDRKLVFGPANNNNGFGTITNNNSDNAVDEVITVTYRARVLNATQNVNGERRRNRARWHWKPTDRERQRVEARAPRITIIEPAMALTKVFTPDTGDNLSPPMVTMTIEHDGGSTADAFDLAFIDPLPVDLGIVGGAGGVTLNNCPATSRLDVQTGGLSDTLLIDWDEFTTTNGLCTISFQTEFLVPILAGITLENCAFVRWQSMADLNQPADGTPNNSPGIAVERTGDTDDPGGAANTYQREACDQYKVFDVGISKAVKSTSQSHTDNIPGTPPETESLTIGEVVTFELIVTIPETPTVELKVDDLLPKTAMVLELVSAATTAVGADLSPAVPDPVPTITDGSGNGVNDSVELDYGSVSHVVDGVTDDRDRIRIDVVAKVLDRVENANNDLDNNSALVRFLPQLSSSDDYGIEIVEPLLDIEKTGNTSRVEAGDEVTYRLTVQHSSGSRTDAQDLELTDTLPPELSLVPGSAMVGQLCSAPPTSGPSQSVDTVSASWDDFPLGGICEIEFRATVDISAITGQEIINDATISWTSLDTTGDADDRPYNQDDTWKVVVSPPGLTKLLTDTSIPETRFSLGAPSHDLTIGEEATFTVTAEFPDGTTRVVRISDLLPDAGVALAFTGTRIVSIGSDLDIQSAPAVGDPAIDCNPPASSCQQWVLGNVVNLPDSRPQPDTEDVIVFEVKAIVLDDPLNSGAPGDDENLLNTAHLASPDAQLIATDQFDLVEPQLNIQKLTQSGSFEGSTAAGKTETFTLIVEHIGGLSTATAHSIVIEDRLAAEMEWVDDASVSSSCPGLRLDIAPAVGSSGLLQFSFDQLTLDTGRCTISFDVKMSDTLPVPGVYINQSALTWESAPGSPQSRTYFDQALAILAAFTDAFMVKNVTATSVPDTDTSVGDPTLEDVAIGEVIEYEIIAKFTEGITENVVLLDTFQQDGAGELELLGGAVTFVGANVTSSNPGTPVVAGNTITIDYGTVTNVADGVQDKDDTIVYRLELQVRDVAANTDSDVLLNEADMEYAVLGGTTGMVSDSAEVEVVEPDLVMTKQFTDLVTDVASIQLDLVNNGSSAAYDVLITDEFDEAIWVPGSLDAISIPPGYELYEASAGGITTVTLQASNPATPPAANQILLPGETLTVGFSLRLQNNGQPGPTTIPNTAEAEATSLPGSNPAERTYTTDGTDTLLLPAITLVKTWTGPNTPALPGDTLTYTLSLSNTGDAPANNAVIDDTPDALGLFQAGSVLTNAGTNSDSGSIDSGNLPGDTSVTASFSILDAGATVSVSYDVVVPLPYPDGQTAPEEFLNQGQAITTELTPIISDDPSTPDPNDPTIVPILADPIMTISKDDQVPFTLPGETLVYALDYGNAGNQDATGVVISETVPANTVFDSANSTVGWTCTDGAPAGTSCSLAVGPLPGAVTGAALFAVRIDNPVPGGVISIVNTVDIEEDGAEFGQPPSAPSTDTATEETPLQARPDLEIIKDDFRLYVEPGQSYSYTIIYQNTGTQEATGLVLTEVVPDDVTFNAALSTPSNWSCADGSFAGTVCTLDGGSLQGGFGLGARFGVSVLNPAESGVERIFNEVEITDDGANTPAPLTASDSDTDILRATPDLLISKTNDAGNLRLQDIVIYELSYSNIGNQDATGAMVTEVVPEGTEYSAGDSSPTVWSCADGSTAGTVCEHLIGDLAAGDSGTLNFAVIAVEIPADQEVTNVAIINNDGSNGPDPTPGNNITRYTNRFPVLKIPALSPAWTLSLVLALLLIGLHAQTPRRQRPKH